MQASQLFAVKGFAVTATRAFVELTGVNEVTLFRHFGTKEKLARAVLEQFGGAAIAEDPICDLVLFNTWPLDFW